MDPVADEVSFGMRFSAGADGGGGVDLAAGGD
jgi:hypothetical protein